MVAALSGSFTAPGVLDTHTVVIAWGDGSANTTLNLAASVLTFSTTHQYLDNQSGNAPYNISATLTDKDARWVVRGVQAGYSSPVSDDQRIYIADNGGVLFAFDVKDGKQLWRKNLGTIQKSSPVLADGKLYVGTENGKFFIVRPSADRAEVLEAVERVAEDRAVLGQDADVLARLPDHPANKVADLLPWSWKASHQPKAAAAA